MMYSFQGKTVLITGAAKRVGAVIARTFAEAGAKLIIHYNTSECDAVQLLDELGGEKAGHRIAAFDLTHPETISSFVQTLPENIDVLVNNASVFRRSQFQNESLDQAKLQFDINFWSPMELIKTLCRHTTSEDFSVVNVADCMIEGNAADSFSYLLSKKALAEATKCAALQLAPNVRINAVAPGPVIPPPGLRMEKTLPLMPLKRAVNPRDLAESVLFLAANRSVTGTTLAVDCGRSLLV